MTDHGLKNTHPLSLDMPVEHVMVFSKPSCVQCNATYRALNSKGIAYEVIDISEEDAFIEELKAESKMQVPVVMAPGMEAWTGFRPDLIAKIAA